ncbi:MAG: hypothetical protein SFV17_11345 [Candidatus Obscuribacter sp.]|nr:hypothetical protein [Candidatus Obscuribacter sp.]
MQSQDSYTDQNQESAKLRQEWLERRISITQEETGKQTAEKIQHRGEKK